jgi:hypothetical protein
MTKHKYNQGDMIGYKHILYVITGIEGEYYAGVLVGDPDARRQVNRIIDIDDNDQIRLVARG